jgi:hypothetical protein
MAGAGQSALNPEIFRRCLAFVRDFLVFDGLTFIETLQTGSLDGQIRLCRRRAAE